MWKIFELRLFPTRLLTSEDEYKWFWHQMIYFPGTINIVSTQIYTSIMDSLFIFQLCTSTYSVHAGILKLWRGRLPCLLVVFSFHYVSRLSSSFVRSQLTLLVPALRVWFPLSQDGAPIHRVRTHSLSRVQHNDLCHTYLQVVGALHDSESVLAILPVQSVATGNIRDQCRHCLSVILVFRWHSTAIDSRITV